MNVLVRLLLINILVASLCGSSFAQPATSKFEVNGSIGFVSGTEVWMHAFVHNPRVNEYLDGASPNLFISGKYYLAARFAIGMAVGYQGIWVEDRLSGVPYRYTNYSFTFCPEATFVYYQNKAFQSYFLLGLGVSYQNFIFDQSNGAPYRGNPEPGPVMPRTQFTFLGLRMGKDLAAMLELGFGYKGLVNGGLSYRFKARKAISVPSGLPTKQQ
jgi:hypothetical protein